MKVLFVCSGNAHRSPLAEALLKKLRPDLEVDSAGIHTVIPISEEARVFSAKDNAERFLKQVPESLESKQLNIYNIIVAMEQIHEKAILSRCPECINKVIVWNIRDPYFLPPEYAEKIYKQIREKVSDLAKSL